MRRLRAPACVLLCLALAACGTATVSSKFKGEEHEVAQTVSNLQSAVASSEQKKVCEYLAASVVARLGGTKGCEQAIKEQLKEIDNTELEAESVKIDGEQATATVKSVYGGKKRQSTVTLVKQNGKWKIASLS
jgi:Domain of unknown function (DUF4878)